MSVHPLPVALIYNPIAGSTPRVRPRRTAQEVAAALARHGAEPHLLPTRARGDGVARGEEAARTFGTIAILGGDGTMNEAINGIVAGMAASGTDPRILLLPGGTINVLARDLKIPLDPLRAAALVTAGRERRIFLGRAGPRYFALMASAGVDASIVAHLAESRLKRPLGVFAYMMEGMRHTAAYHFPRIVIRTEDRQVDGYLAVVGNSSGYGGWFSLTPGANAAEPGFQVAVCTSAARLKYYYYLGCALAGVLQHSADFTYFSATRVSIEAATAVPVQLDGEPYGTVPIEITCADTSLSFLVPA